MSEQAEPPERTANEHAEHLTFAQAAERLNISPDAVRMRVRRGKLTSVSLNNRMFVVWPQPEVPEQSNEQRTERTSSANSSDIQSDTRLISALEAHIASLERQLSERTEEIRRRDHIIAGFLERLPETREIAAGEIITVENEAPETDETENAALDANPAPQRDDTHSMADLTLHQDHDVLQPAGESVVRRWWRKMVGG